LLVYIVENSVLFARQQRENNDFLNQFGCRSASKGTLLLSYFCKPIVISKTSHVSNKTYLFDGVYNMVFQVTRGIFVNFHLYFDFWRVCLTDLNGMPLRQNETAESKPSNIYLFSVMLFISPFTVLCLIVNQSIYDISTILDYYQSYLCSSISDLIPLSPALLPFYNLS
jgi:hypothetical protein